MSSFFCWISALSDSDEDDGSVVSIRSGTEKTSEASKKRSGESPLMVVADSMMAGDGGEEGMGFLTYHVPVWHSDSCRN